MLEKVEELGEPVREDNDASRSCKVTLAGGLNERAVAILLLFEELGRRMILCKEHHRGFLCPSQINRVEPEQLRDVAVKPTLILKSHTGT